MAHFLTLLILLFPGSLPSIAGDPRPLPPVEARKKVGEKITVEMKVQAAKDRLEKRGEIYLDAEPNFRDEKNFAVVITKVGAAKLKESGIDDPASHFMDKIIRATGEVKLVQDVPRIEIDDARQIRIVPAKELPKDSSRLLKRIEELGGKAAFGPGDKDIFRIHLGGTQAVDDDLVLIGASTDLVELSLAKTNITDAGLPSLSRLKKLEALHLADNPLTDTGVAAIKDMTQLELLGLKGTQVTDNGLAHLSGMKKLQWLGLRNARQRRRPGPSQEPAAASRRVAELLQGQRRGSCASQGPRSHGAAGPRSYRHH